MTQVEKIGTRGGTDKNDYLRSDDKMTDQVTNPKDKAGQRKPQLHLIPPVANVFEALVMRDGASKYGPFNWRQDKIALSTYISAIHRHLAAFQDGETHDMDSGCPHMAHIRANTGIILDAMEQGMAVDDRCSGYAPQVIAGITREETEISTKIDLKTLYPYLISAEIENLFVDNTPIPEPYDYEIGIDFANGEDSSAIVIMEPGTYEIGPNPDGNVTPIVVYDPPPLPAVEEEHPSAPKAASHFYICGPMRGLPFYNFPAFDGARDLGLSKGHLITSPADIDRDNGLDAITDWGRVSKIVENWGPDDIRNCVMRDLNVIMNLNAGLGDGVAVLPGWEDSVGAVAEIAVAHWLGLRVVSALDFATPIAKIKDVTSVYGQFFSGGRASD